jgi:hypothetical protein
MPLDENEAWERMRAAILRCQADPIPTNEHLAEVRRHLRALTAAWEGAGADDQCAVKPKPTRAAA